MTRKVIKRNTGGSLEAHEGSIVYLAKRNNEVELHIYRGETYYPVKRYSNSLYTQTLDRSYSGISFEGNLIVFASLNISSVYQRTAENKWVNYGTETVRAYDALLNLSGELYAVSDANTYRLNPTTLKWENIPSPTGTTCYDAIVHSGELWIGMVSGSNSGIYVRQSGSWVKKLNISGYSFSSSGSTLWACAGNNIYEWDGSSFNAIIAKSSFAMCYFLGKLTYWRWDGHADAGIYQWDGSTSTQLGTDKFRSHNGGICYLFSDGFDLWAGSFSDNVYKWSAITSTWTQMGTLDAVAWIFKHSGAIYACSVSSDISGVYRWDDPNWTLI